MNVIMNVELAIRSIYFRVAQKIDLEMVLMASLLPTTILVTVASIRYIYLVSCRSQRMELAVEVIALVIVIAQIVNATESKRLQRRRRRRRRSRQTMKSEAVQSNYCKSS